MWCLGFGWLAIVVVCRSSVVGVSRPTLRSSLTQAADATAHVDEGFAVRRSAGQFCRERQARHSRSSSRHRGRFDQGFVADAIGGATSPSNSLGEFTGEFSDIPRRIRWTEIRAGTRPNGDGDEKLAAVARN
jgi:hypothetical protein